MGENDVVSYLKMLLHFYNEFFNTSLKFRETFDIDELTPENIKKYEDDWGHTFEKGIIVKSHHDNTIPACLFDLIEEKFDTYRRHLG
jgi:hypothetical protein